MPTPDHDSDSWPRLENPCRFTSGSRELDRRGFRCHVIEPIWFLADARLLYYNPQQGTKTQLTKEPGRSSYAQAFGGSFDLISDSMLNPA